MTVIYYSIVSGILILLLIVGGYFDLGHSRKIIPHRLKMPSSLTNPSTLVGSGFLLKSPFFEDKRLDNITDIKVGEFDPSPGREIGIAGSRGAVFLDANAHAKSTVIFNSRKRHVDIIDVEGDGICEFLNRGSWSQDASLINHKGNEVWSYGGRPAVDDTAAGDIDGDGFLEFAVGFNGGGGVHLLDRKGKVRWKQSDGNVWHVEMADTNGDGKLEIVHSNAGGEITVRDRNGNVVSQNKPAPYFSDFSLCKWPSKKDREYALLAENDTIWLFDFNGKTVMQFAGPQCGKLGDARGTLIKLRNDQPEYLATIVDFENWKRAILYVHDSMGKLLYQEILPESCASIATISLDNSLTETLLIGGEDRVWQYKVQSAGNPSEVKQ